MLSKSTIKYIQSLQHKKFRDEHEAFVAEGPKLVSELLQAGSFKCLSIYALSAWIEQFNKTVIADRSPVAEPIVDFELEKISGLATPNEVVAVFAKDLSTTPVIANGKITLVLDEIQDPGNLGTIIRSAHWFAVTQIVCSKHSADLYNPKVVQSTMASLGRVKVFYTDLPAWLQQQTAKKYAATLSGQPMSDFITDREPVIIVIGNESKGVSNDVLRCCDAEISIQRKGDAESLNASVAAAIILHAFSAS